MRGGILKMIATNGFLTAPECTKFVFGRNSSPDPAGELTTFPQTLSAAPFPPPRCLRHLVSDACVGVFVPPLSNVWLRRWTHLCYFFLHTPLFPVFVVKRKLRLNKKMMVINLQIELFFNLFEEPFTQYYLFSAACVFWP